MYNPITKKLEPFMPHDTGKQEECPSSEDMSTMSFSATYLIYLHHAILPALSHYLSVALHRLILFYLASMYTRKSRAGHSNNAHSSVSMSSSTKGVQSRTRLVDCNLGWRGPIISESELAKLGTEVELLRVRHSCQLPCFALPCFA